MTAPPCASGGVGPRASSRPAALTIDVADLAAVLEHCRRELPNEACGILGGRGGTVESVHPVRNLLASPARFAMDPAEQYRALEAIRCAGRETAGIYHSHPSGPAGLSSADREGACWPGTPWSNYPGALQLVVSLQDSSAPVVRGYALDAGSFTEVPIRIVEQGAEQPA